MPLLQCPTEWPSHIESSLKNLMIQHALFAYPDTDDQNEKKVWRIFVELRKMVETKGWEPVVHDERLWGLLQVKLASIRAQMLRNWEVYNSAEGYKLSAKCFPNPRTRLSIPREQLIAYPQAPILSRVRCFEALQTWKSIDMNTQMKLFREQLRSSKHPQRLIYEWEQFINENPPKQAKGVTEVDKLNPPVEKVDSQKRSQARSPPATPRPDIELTESNSTEPKPKDLKTMMEDRIREIELKRQLEKRKRAREEVHQDELGRIKRVS